MIQIRLILSFKNDISSEPADCLNTHLESLKNLNSIFVELEKIFQSLLLIFKVHQG